LRRNFHWFFQPAKIAGRRLHNPGFAGKSLTGAGAAVGVGKGASTGSGVTLAKGGFDGLG
jgi:hypothetical protein